MSRDHRTDDQRRQALMAAADARLQAWGHTPTYSQRAVSKIERALRDGDRAAAALAVAVIEADVDVDVRNWNVMCHPALVGAAERSDR